VQALVSIIIPTYNRAHLLGETLDSVIAQTYNKWECIIVDDGSTDYTEVLLGFYCEKDSRIQFYERELLPKGASHCRNIGLEKAKGNYCIFLDSDDLLLDFCIETRLKNSRLFPNRDFWVVPMFAENGQKQLTKCEIPEKSDYLVDFLSGKLYWQTMCTFWDINFLRSIQGFNDLYPRLNDPEIHIRAMLKSQSNYVVFSNNEPDSKYRLEAEVKEKTEFALKYYQSLILFIPDITNQLVGFNKKNNVHFLKEYLKDYTKNIFQYNKRQNNLKLFNIFYKNKILSYYEYLNLILFYYIFLTLKKVTKKNRRRIDKFLEK